jgi:tol-pal system protein YbgF
MRFLPLLFIPLILLGCVSPQEVSQVREDVTSVYSEQTTYMKKTDQRLANLEKTVDELQRAVGTPEQGLRKEVVDLSLAGENRDEKIKTLLGKIDELESQLRTYWEEVKAELRDMRRGKDNGGMTTTTAPAPAKGSPEELYKQGFDAFQKGSYDNAIEIFTQFAKQNPDSPLAPNAYYWMGESYMNVKNYEKAIVQFQEVIDKFPKSDKAGRAMVRQAEAFGILGDKKSSTTLLKRVIELFPKTEEARMAERMLLRSGSVR